MDSTTLYIGVIQFIVLLLSLSVHESAHAWTADRLGDPTARLLGRVSLNPIVHVDLLGTIILPIMGLVTGIMFGWAKPVPVMVSRLRNPTRDHMFVAAAGPVSNLLLAALMFAVLMAIKVTSPDLVALVADFRLPRGYSPILTPLAMVAFWGMILNIILAIFNLIPVPPLDGASVLSGLLPRSLSSLFDQLGSYGFIILILLIVQGIPAQLYMPAVYFVQSFFL